MVMALKSPVHSDAPTRCHSTCLWQRSGVSGEESAPRMRVFMMDGVVVVELTDLDFILRLLSL